MKCINCEKKDKELKMIKELYRDILDRFNKLSLKLLKLKAIVR